MVYLLLTAGSGRVLLFWSAQELWAGVFLAALTSLLSRKFFSSARVAKSLNPLRWVLMVVYVVGPFFAEMAKANLDVAYRVITGRIRPGIVRVKSGMKTDVGVLTLAHSITLTPGTLTVGIDEDSNDLFVHMINVPEGMEAREFVEAKELFSLSDCPAWIRRIAE